MGKSINFLANFGFVLKKMEYKDLKDDFFDSFKIDYPEFENWFLKKIKNNDEAFYFFDKNKIIGFIKLKKEIDSNIGLENEVVLKICSYKLLNESTCFANNAFFEIFDFTKKNNIKYIYATVFDKHIKLINKMLKLGFDNKGKNDRNELILVKKIDL
tara:strand:+ start:276 stop:746 length:471 start_codon:yes stop_codon:yes gene_type:complete